MMAATQAEPPVSESSMEQEHPSQEIEHGAGLQNGEKNNKPPSGGGGMGSDVPMGPKGKMQNNVSMMDGMNQNQYRQDPGANPQMNNNNDQGLNNSEETPNSDNKMYPPPGEGQMPHPYPGGPNYPHPPRGNYHPDMDHMNQMRHAYKPMPRSPNMGPMAGGYPQQRFISGQSISQPTGPTPTLNQLLQSNNPGGHRFQNRYPEPYSQNWPPPRGMAPYGAQQGPPPPPGAYRNQPPLTRGVIPPSAGPGQPPGSPNYNASAAGDQPPVSPTNSPYPQRYHTPSARQPYTQHPYAPQPGTQNYDPQQRQQWGAQQSPHPPQAQSPHPPQASPQSPQSRPQQASTPNPHAPDPADISGQNSNDSVGATTPNSTNMRPTPSPTSSSGSRSVSPAVGSYGPRPQGNIQQYGAYNAQAPPGPGSQYQYHMQHGQFPGGPGAYQHNFNQGMPPSPSGYPMGPPMGPPGSTPVPNSHPHEPMHPPSSAPNSHIQMHSDSSSDSAGPPALHDNGYSSPGAGSNQPSAGGATSIVTTGPDGTQIDEASQQSTLSNASAASGGEDSACPPKRPCGPSPNTGMLGPMGWGNRHPNAPSMAPCSPGAAPPINSMPEEFTPAPTPTWPRAHSSHKHDSLSKLFDMDETPERRHFLDKLLSFMEERGSPITTCPTISKNLLDLFRLYLFVKERGGFLEVCRVNKNKIWKDIAGLLNIGASSSAAYTLRKHYVKNILPFECHFDRGGIDPQPIINQVEASTKKKGAKAAPTVPSPGSSNSQDSFPSSAGGSMDGYGGYGYPPDFNNQRPPTQPPQGYQGQGYPQYPDQYNQQYPPPNRAVYPYGPEGDRNYNQSGPGQSGPPMGQPAQPGMPPGAQPNAQDYRGGPYMGANQAGYAPRGAYPGPGVNQQAPGSSPAPGVNQQFPVNQPNQPSGTPPSQEYFRQDAPRRHPDFTKDQQPPSPQATQPAGYGPTPGPYPQQRPVYPGWSGNQNNSQYRGPSYPPQQWNQGPPRPAAPGNSVPPSPQWDQSRSYPPNSQQPFPSQQPAWAQNNNMRMMGPRMDVRPPSDPSKPFPPSPATMTKPGQAPPGVPGATTVKREIQFPPDSVEAVTPVLYKRRKLGRSDVAPVEAWRLMMSLKSGLLAETCWAIDVLNILLFDDMGVAYFGLSHLPGLLDILLEHFKKSLSDMLESETNVDQKWYERPKPNTEIPDLGVPSKSVDDKNAIAVVKSKRNHVESRKKPVSIVDAEDVFVTDGPRNWETFPYENEEPESDTSYIIPCFRAEFGNVPFARILEEKEKNVIKIEKECPSEEESKTNSCVNSFVQNNVKIEPVAEIEQPKDDEESESKDRPSDEQKEVQFQPQIKDPSGNLKRRRLSDYEDESYCRDEASLYPVSDSQDNIARRCIALSNILRNLTFVPGNELEFAKSATFLRLLGRLILTYHEHGLRITKTRNYDRDDENEWSDCCSSLSPQAESEWWWDYIENIRENVLVSLANIAGHIDLDLYPEDITRPILDGLLHWAVCPAAQGQDPFPSSMCNLSPQRLALEALCKLCVTDNNVDLVIATPPYSRLERLTYVLTRFLCKNEDQVLREFAVNLLHYLAAADSAMSRTIALQSPCISLLVAFIEQAEQNALGVANQHGIGALRDNPDTMGTSLDMLRRTARTLLHLSKHPDNKSLFMQQEQRLLALVMSQILDQQVAAIISRVLYQTRPDLYQNR